MTPNRVKTRTMVLSTGLAAVLAGGAVATAVALPAQQAGGTPSAASCSAAEHRAERAAAPQDCDSVGTPVELGEPTPGATDDWQATGTNGVGYKVPAHWTGEEAAGDGGPGHEWIDPEPILTDEFGDLNWRILVQSPFVDQEMPDPDELDELGFHASYVEVEGASEAVLTATQTGHWWDPSIEIIDFQLFVQSAETGVVTRFMGELPAGEEGRFLLDNFVPTVRP